ncbi:hypothetical protein MRX96_014812 [Rhipicephalus microplus]
MMEGIHGSPSSSPDTRPLVSQYQAPPLSTIAPQALQRPPSAPQIPAQVPQYQAPPLPTRAPQALQRPPSARQIPAQVPQYQAPPPPIKSPQALPRPPAQSQPTLTTASDKEHDDYQDRHSIWVSDMAYTTIFIEGEMVGRLVEREK